MPQADGNPLTHSHPTLSDGDLLTVLYNSDRRLLSARRLAKIFDVSHRQGRRLHDRLLALPDVHHAPGPNRQTWVWTGTPTELHVPLGSGTPEHRNTRHTPLKGVVCALPGSVPVSVPVSDPRPGHLSDDKRAAIREKIFGPPKPPKLEIEDNPDHDKTCEGTCWWCS